MDKFIFKNTFKNTNLPKLTKEETENSNSPISIKM